MTHSVYFLLREILVLRRASFNSTYYSSLSKNPLYSFEQTRKTSNKQINNVAKQKTFIILLFILSRKVQMLQHFNVAIVSIFYIYR